MRKRDPQDGLAPAIAHKRGGAVVVKPLGVLIWNMALMSPRSLSAGSNMAYLSELIDRHDIDVALLCEASVAHAQSVNAAEERSGRARPYAIS
jgi:hypothetical protein